MIKKIYIFEDSQQSSSGGGQKVSASLINYLTSRGGICVSVFDTRSTKESFFQRCEGIKLITYWRPKMRPTGVGSSFTFSVGQSLVIVAATAFAGIRVLLSLLANSTSRCAVFYCPTKFGYLSALIPSLIFSQKLVVHVHNISEPNLFSRFFQCLLRMTADEVVCVSQTVYDSLQHPRKNLIRNPVPKLREIQLSQRSDCLSFGVIASFFSYKGHRFFLEVAEKLVEKYPQVVVHLFGDGPELATLLQRFMSPSIRFHGRIEDSEVIYSNLDVVVVPSLKPEAYSIVIPEAWSYGCLVLASDVPAHAELIEDCVNGHLFAAGDSKALYSKLEGFIQDWLGQRQMIEGGRASLALLGSVDFARQLSQLFLK